MMKFADEINKSDDQLLNTTSMEPVMSGITTSQGRICVKIVATSNERISNDEMKTVNSTLPADIIL